jgi:uroporphyrinogen decarboxylase
MVAARGPMATASHLLGVTEFLMGVKLDPKRTHKLMKKMTRLTLDWLNAQAEVLTEVESIMLLDDLVGFLGPEDYEEFAHPYYTQICGSFPGTIKFFHNDMDNPVSFPYLKEWPVDVFNFSHKIPIDKVREMVGERMVLLGNVAPLDVLAKGTPDEVYERAKSAIEDHPQRNGLILSAGGGVSPGTPETNIRALIRAVKE